MVANTEASASRGSLLATTSDLARIALKGALPGAILVAALSALRTHGTCQALWRTFALVFAVLFIPSFVAVFRIASAHLTGRDEGYVRVYLDGAAHGRLELVAGIVAVAVIAFLYYLGPC
ncbi:MAG: hypothetical protein NVS4B3_02460 [Gemmatimonadaceae bacterium]